MNTYPVNELGPGGKVFDRCRRTRVGVIRKVHRDNWKMKYTVEWRSGDVNIYNYNRLGNLNAMIEDYKKKLNEYMKLSQKLDDVGCV